MGSNPVESPEFFRFMRQLRGSYLHLISVQLVAYAAQYTLLLLFFLLFFFFVVCATLDCESSSISEKISWLQCVVCRLSLA